MAKGYWISSYQSIGNPDALAAYAKLAAPAILGAGGRFVVRGSALKTYEAGKMMRTVVVEFDSVAKAIEVHDGAAYQEALRVLGDGAVRDFRIAEGMADSPGAACDGKPHGYMVNTYRAVMKQDALDAYARLAGPAMAAAGARFLIRGMPAKAYESGMMQRTVVVEFPSVQAVIDGYEGTAYAKALAALGEGAAVRDMRVVEGAV